MNKSDDTIRRQDAINAVEKESQVDGSYGYCEYCNEDSDGHVKPIEKNNHAFVRFGMNGWELILKANGWRGSAKIRYCPMCGRDLFAKRGVK